RPVDGAAAAGPARPGAHGPSVLRGACFHYLYNEDGRRFGIESFVGIVKSGMRVASRSGKWARASAKVTASTRRSTTDSGAGTAHAPQNPGGGRHECSCRTAW